MGELGAMTRRKNTFGNLPRNSIRKKKLHCVLANSRPPTGSINIASLLCTLVGPFFNFHLSPRKSSMASFARPFVISLLVGMAALGHAPAWLHVASCDRETHSSGSDSPSIVGRGCCQHAVTVAESQPEKTGGKDHHHSHGDHDSDSCLICQSLALPNGIAWQLDLPACFQEHVELINVSGVAAPESTSLSIPQPRGPPAPLA